ncbi:hypothetical protein ACLESD_15110 [Pyxidicoccus sp. 3LFB2]
MTKDLLFLVLAIPLSSCVRGSRPVAREDDPSIVFPRFFEQATVEVGASGGTYELDGVTLRALTVAADDFLPPDAKRPACWDKLESHRYRVIRQAEVIFVRIDEDPEACGRPTPALHSGASYAISLEGRILRSLMDGQPDMAARPDGTDAIGAGVLAPPGTSSQPQVAPGESPPDGGTGLTPGSEPDGGPPTP